MILRDFIKIISELKLLENTMSGTMRKIMIGSNCANPNCININTLNSWLKDNNKGKRDIPIDIYFPNGIIDHKNLCYLFYNKITKVTMQQLQDKFNEYDNINDDSIMVDLETTDKHTFCWSLVNQFLQIIGLETILTPANYLKKVTEKYEETNNIIFTDKGMPFYDFYVPNNVSISKYKYTGEEKEKLSKLKVKFNNLYRDIDKIEKMNSIR